MSLSRFSRSGAFLAVLSLTVTAALAHENTGALESDATICHQKHSKHALEHKSHVPEVKHSILINAKPEHVWEAIQHQRKADDHRKLLSYDGSAATLHETFASLPIVGEASCVYVENESAQHQRIDYALLKSDRFAVFQGSWIISPGKDGTTSVELSNAIDPGIRVPFWQDITKMAASRLVKRRLDSVSAYAEQLQKTENSRIR